MSEVIDENPAATLRAMTGAHTKMVWIRSSGGVGSPFGPSDATPRWRIVALDTDEPKERYLTSAPSSCSHCMITPTGSRVVWTETGGIWICDWDGKNARKLMDAPIAVGVAEDPPGTEWVYVEEGPKVHASNTDQIGSIVRYQIDDLAKKELVWNKTGSNDKWEFTRDGKFGASGLPWPNAGIVSLPNGTLKNFGVGCTPGVSGDASIVMHMQADGHRGIDVYNADGSKKRYIDFKGAAPGRQGIGDPQFWYASFVRYDKRFFTVNGPFPSMTFRGNLANIYFCQFNETFSGVAKWVIVSSEKEVQTHAYAWIEPPDIAARPRKKAVAAKKEEKTEAAAASDKWPTDAKGLLFSWDAKNQPPAALRVGGFPVGGYELQPRGAARQDGSALLLEGGSFVVAPNVEQSLKAQINRELTLEASFTPAKSQARGLAEIVSLSTSSDDYDLVLGQEDNQLVFSLKTVGSKEKPTQVRLCPMTPGDPCHIILTCAPGVLTCHKNGKMVSAAMDFTGNCALADGRHLVFGANWDAKHPWQGALEAIAFYNRALDGKEAQLQYAARQLRAKNHEVATEKPAR